MLRGVPALGGPQAHVIDKLRNSYALSFPRERSSFDAWDFLIELTFFCSFFHFVALHYVQGSQNEYGFHLEHLSLIS